jgi:SNF2 family DNA or RNA helicase
MIGLEESDAIINKCCGLVMCATCGIKGARMSTGYAGADGVAIKGNCPQCRAPIQLNELIFINQNFDLNEMIDAQGDEVGEVGNTADAGGNTTDTTADDDGNGKAEDTTPVVELLINKNPKLHALCEIIKGNNVEHTVIDPQLKSLIQGCRDVPVPAGTLRKVIVFAAFTETLQLIQECMEQQKIPFTRLMGTYKQIHQTVMDFRTNDTQVLLINSSTNCAGLDLQFSTDLVFFHKILDTKIQSQVAGRMQRVGREFNGNVHWLLYRNESTYI